MTEMLEAAFWNNAFILTGYFVAWQPFFSAEGYAVPTKKFVWL